MINKILVVDDEAIILKSFARNLRTLGYTVLTASSGAESLALYGQEYPDLVLSDMRMADMDGMALIHEIQQLDPEATLILVTGHADRDMMHTAMQAGAADVLLKPIDTNTLIMVLLRAEAHIQLKHELRHALGASPPLDADIAAECEDIVTAQVAAARSEAESEAVQARFARQQVSQEIRGLAKFPAEDPNPVIRVRGDGLILYANAVTRTLWPDWNYVVGTYVAQALQAAVAEALKTHTQKVVEVTYDTHTFVLTLVPIVDEGYVNLYGRDITPRKGMEQALAEAQEVLELRVQERTAELARANAELLAEVARRRQTEASLRESQQRFSAMWDSAPVAAVLVNAEGHIVLANARTEAIFGYQQKALLEQTIEFLLPERFQLSHIQHRANYMANPKTRPMGIGMTLAGKHKDGHEFPVEVALSLIESQDGDKLVMALIMDISVQKQAEEDLARAQARAAHAGKLVALGEMATGVAHEINQPLTAMQFEADYLKTLVEKQAAAQPLNGEEIYQIAQNLSGDIARCHRVIQHLLTFGCASHQPAVPLDVNVCLEDSLIMTEALLKSRGIEIHRQLTPDLPSIMADSRKLEQVFINLFSNALYALEQRAAQEKGEPAYVKKLQLLTYINDEKHVVVEIGDNGIGIPQQHQKRIFEPFFTTKPFGQGTGLGLATSYGIVTEAGGDITFISVENEGATFVLRFPAIVMAAE